MERMLIILAVLACVVAGFAVVAMSLRDRRAPLRMDSDLDVDDEDLLLASIGAPDSPIDRTAEVLDARNFEAQVPNLEPVEVRTRIEAQRRIAGPQPEDGR